MPVCAKCGTNNIEGATFCASCGSTIGQPPAPESWRASSELGGPPAGATEPPRPPSGEGGYAPPSPPQPNYPVHNQPHVPAPGYQQPVVGGSQPMHPAVPAIVSFMLPGIGLLFVPNKAGLGMGIFAGYVGLIVVFMIFAFVTLGLGTCLAPVLMLANVAAGIHSWDEAAKASGGQFQPLLFK